MLDGLQALADGIFDTAALMHSRKPSSRRTATCKAGERAQACTPCAANAYVQGLRQAFVPGKAPR